MSSASKTCCSLKSTVLILLTISLTIKVIEVSVIIYSSYLHFGEVTLESLGASVPIAYGRDIIDLTAFQQQRQKKLDLMKEKNRRYHDKRSVGQRVLIRNQRSHIPRVITDSVDSFMMDSGYKIFSIIFTISWIFVSMLGIIGITTRVLLLILVTQVVYLIGICQECMLIVIMDNPFALDPSTEEIPDLSTLNVGNSSQDVILSTHTSSRDTLSAKYAESSSKKNIVDDDSHSIDLSAVGLKDRESSTSLLSFLVCYAPVFIHSLTYVMLLIYCCWFMKKSEGAFNPGVLNESGLPDSSVWYDKNSDLSKNTMDLKEVATSIVRPKQSSSSKKVRSAIEIDDDDVKCRSRTPIPDSGIYEDRTTELKKASSNPLLTVNTGEKNVKAHGVTYKQFDAVDL